jgi:hypothetical protein
MQIFPYLVFLEIRSPPVKLSTVLIRYLKKTLDVNGISVDFISNFAFTLSRPQQHIFSLSLSTGKVPVQLKIAKVIPVFKAGDRSVMDNYHPISLLNAFSKVLERVVHNRLSAYLNINNL